MPEYLSPGVYVEETTFRSKSIEGVATSTTGFAGVTRYGPVQYVDGGRRGPGSTEARLITSFTEFERVYGGLEQIVPDDGSPARESYLAHAARAFFLNGGRRLYVSRVFAPTGTDPNLDWGVARLALPFGTNDWPPGGPAGPASTATRWSPCGRCASATAPTSTRRSARRRRRWAAGRSWRSPSRPPSRRTRMRRWSPRRWPSWTRTQPFATAADARSRFSGGPAAPWRPPRPP